jgi:hypothetical protein
LIGGALSLVTATNLVFATRAWNDPFHPLQSGGQSASVFFLVFFLVPLLTTFVGSLAAVAVRFWGSSGDERLQLKWFATAAALVVATFVPGFFSSSPNPSALISVIQSLGFVSLFAAIAIAVLKYRLYDIDVVINKTAVYALLATFFTVVYVAVVVGLGTAIGSASNRFLTLVAAAVIAIAFNPVRERAKRLADRLVYGTRATPLRSALAVLRAHGGHLCLRRYLASDGARARRRDRRACRDLATGR